MARVSSCGYARNAGTSEVLRKTQLVSGTTLPAACLLPWGVTLGLTQQLSCFAHSLQKEVQNSKQGQAHSSLCCGGGRGHRTSATSK